MSDLFSVIDREVNAEAWKDWRPSPPPELHGVKEIELDFETTGLKWWERDEPIGVGYWLDDGRHGYLPVGHEGGNNLPKEQVVSFLKGLQGITITNLNSKFDINIARNWDVDFEEQGCTWSDVGHHAALLDDHRKTFSLAALCNDYLTDEEKVTEVAGAQIDARRMKEYPAGMIAVRAIADVRQVNKLKKLFRPKLEAEDLMRVKKLEDETIYAVCEMERNGLPIDVEKLNRWVIAARREYEACLWRIFRETGLNFNPDANDSWNKLFVHLKLPIENFTAKGKGSFTGAVLKRIQHPLVQTGLQAARLADLLSKYLVKYQKTVGTDGILRFSLHQLKTDKDPHAGEREAGTVSGRFSGSAISVNGEEIGANPQQVIAVEKNMESYGDDFIVRELFIGGQRNPGGHRNRVISADAEQIEYRIFADYARSPWVLAAYAENPRLKFHDLIWDRLKPYKPDLLYKPLKNLNFARMYGAKPIKLSLMMEFITPQDFKELTALSSTNYRAAMADPRLRPVMDVLAVYNQELPEVEPLLREATSLAEKRGFVKTIEGRRMRFPYYEFTDRQGNKVKKRDRTHKALNGVIQGSAADIMKHKLVEIRKERRTLPFLVRVTVHDEVFGDALDDSASTELAKLLDRQAFPDMKVPILWGVEEGENWAEQEIAKVRRQRTARGAA
jgi:DNA polymerase I-like protein with 3'-5' exonuclease and polymerase domains